MNAVTPQTHLAMQAAADNYLNWVENQICAYGLARLDQPSETFTDHDHRISNVVQLPAALSQLESQYQLNDAELFLLCLAGSLEQSYWLNLAIAELQAPMNNPWLPVHLVSDILNSLFQVAINPLTLVHHPLVDDGILQKHGSGPAPTQSLSIDSHLWQALCGHSVACTELAVDTSQPLSEADLDTVRALSQSIRLGHIQTLVIRGNRSAARQYAYEIGHCLNRKPVSLEFSQWQEQKSLQQISTAQHWLPVFELQLGPADELAMPVDKLIKIVISGREGVISGQNIAEINLSSGDIEQRLGLWRHYLPEPQAQRLSRSCLIATQDISRIAQTAKTLSPDAIVTGQTIRQAREQLYGGQLRRLAHPVKRHVSADALVLPDRVSVALEQLLTRCQRREQLWTDLGVTSKASRNAGVRALFSGESGTGKTLAASFVASELHAPLFRLDLASVMNKYIGETEKNLGLLLDEAADTDAIILMDEADSLFGKRTDGDHAGDRFANSLTNYLLTRIESHPGIVLLTTNGRARIDSAFTRRLDAIIEFTQPGVAERFQLWRNHLGARNPDDQFCRLLAAYADLSGGFIRNAVISAATATPVETFSQIPKTCLLTALCLEYHKLGLPVPIKLQQLVDSYGVADDAQHNPNQ
ncbi:MAG: ATP-binding protein [Reinekea sp.]